MFKKYIYAHCRNMRINSVSNFSYKPAINSYFKNEESYTQRFKYSTSCLECISNNNIAFCERKLISIYAVSKSGEVQRFDNKTQAALELDLNLGTITKILNGDCYEANGYTFFAATDVETLKENGEVVIDEEIIQKAINNFDSAKTKPVYAFNYDGEYKRYDSCAIASKYIGASIQSISKCALKGAHSANGYVFTPAIEIEGVDELGNTKIDYSVIKEELSRFSKVNNYPICSINYAGHIVRYKTEQDAFDELGRIKPVRDLEKPIQMTHGKIIVSENLILKRDKRGHTILDDNGQYVYDIGVINKLLEAYETVRKKPVMAKNVKTKEVMEFENASRASECLGVSKQLIQACLSRRLKSGLGYKFEYLYPRDIKNYTLEEKKSD